jgi:hypothetical protein
MGLRGVFGGGFSIDQVLKSNWELKMFIRRGNKVCLLKKTFCICIRINVCFIYGRRYVRPARTNDRPRKPTEVRCLADSYSMG